ncbi:cobalamin-binding protein [Nitrosarchaeum sp. AC2]|uniref:cobalamin-binding protein n=1 Tax=Nitrosarchaeum sp. AC2 TaxID=2259673 RepID=UPI0015C79496|nr:cobalamin-binding protein [Nitrosarchaeum sp. AC2]QLH10637.1 cobalamin-binding protein [Nitrosarchaeum sp. AC2]
MSVKRIVSFLPSATELLYELEADDILFGVTHECKYPENAKTKLQVISSVINSEELSSNEIDTKTCQLLSEGKEIFVLNEKNMIEANPDLIITQETCEACAAHNNQVNKAIQILQNTPMIHSMNPHNLDEIVKSVNEIGRVIKKENNAMKITESLTSRIEYIKKHTPTTKQKVLALEWIEPFFTSGHWIPGMINDAGGENMISKDGEHSRKIDIDEITKSDPDIIIMMPCGFDTYRTISEYNKTLKNNKSWNSLRAIRNGKVFAVDANSYFSKPSIRTIIGLEILAKIIQPNTFLNLNVPENSFLQIK